MLWCNGQILKFVVQLKIAVTSNTFLCQKKSSGIEKVKKLKFSCTFLQIGLLVIIRMQRCLLSASVLQRRIPGPLDKVFCLGEFFAECTLTSHIKGQVWTLSQFSYFCSYFVWKIIDLLGRYIREILLFSNPPRNWASLNCNAVLFGSWGSLPLTYTPPCMWHLQKLIKCHCFGHNQLWKSGHSKIASVNKPVSRTSSSLAPLITWGQKKDC